MPARTRNRISANKQKVRLSNQGHHSDTRKRIGQQRQTPKRSLHRRTDKSTFGTDTLYSITFADKNKADIALFNATSQSLFTTEKQVIKACKDIATQCEDELQCVNWNLEDNSPTNVLVCITEVLKGYFDGYEFRVEKHNLIPNKYEGTLRIYYEFDSLYWQPFDELWKLCENNKKYQQLLMNALKILQINGVDVCFNSHIEEVYIEMMKENIQCWEDDFNTDGEATEAEIAEFELSQSHYKDEVAFFQAGEFAQLSKQYLAAHPHWDYNIHKLRPQSDNHKKLVEWFKAIDEINTDWTYNCHDISNENNDGGVSIDSMVHIFYTFKETEYLYGAMNDTDDCVAQTGAEQLCWRNIITKETKAPTIPQEFFKLLKIMSFNFKENE